MSKIAPGPLAARRRARQSAARPYQALEAHYLRRALNRAAQAARVVKPGRGGAARGPQPLSGADFRVWTFIVDNTVSYGRRTDRLRQSQIAEETGLTSEAVRRACLTLQEAGLLNYTSGRGDPLTGGIETYSHFEIIEPDGWREAMQPREPAQQVLGSLATDPNRSRGGSPTGDGVGPQHTVGSDPNTCWGFQGSLSRESLQGGDQEGADPPSGVGARVVPLPVETGAGPAPVAAEFFEAMRRTGAPIPSGKQRTITNGITQAMADGYAREAVLVGLGYWIADGHLFATQITEFVQKARLHGGPVPQRGEADVLLTEGRDRFTRQQSRRANGGPSKAEARRAASAAAIREFNRGAR